MVSKRIWPIDVCSEQNSPSIKMKDAFRRATATGEAVLQMSKQAKRELAQSALERLDNLDVTSQTAGAQSMQGILQPLFALSGYRLRAEKERVGKHRFDLIGENLVDGDDRLLVDFKFVRDDTPRSMVPNQILNFVEAIAPSDPTRVIMVSNAGFPSATQQRYANLVGPRLELWDFDDIRKRFETILTEKSERDDLLVQIMLDFLDKLALGIADQAIKLRQIEWRDVERLVAHVLRELGYAAALTNASHDGGRDIIVADINAKKLGVFNIEVKHWAEQAVGSKEVRRLLEVSLNEQRDGALMLATSGVGKAGLRVRTETMTDFLRFGDDEKIALTCRSFAQKRAGLWVAPRPLKSFLFEATR